jgi:uncharacterized protein YndB with AHSA1/START domain
MTETSVTRTVELDAATDTVWDAIVEPDQRAAWLDDHDAAQRTVRVDEVEDGRRLVWTWWRPDGDEPDAATVEIAISPRTGGGTRLVVTETPLRMPVSMSASASAGRRWDYRLLGLELLFVAAGACAL